MLGQSVEMSILIFVDQMMAECFGFVLVDTSVV